MAYAYSEFFANQDVIIYSQSMSGWVPARIESVNADDSVTVKYASGHTKLVPLEHQATNIRDASRDMPPPEPTMINAVGNMDSGLFGMPSLFNTPAVSQGFAGNMGGGQYPNQRPAEHRPAAKYSVNQQVNVFSESSNTWKLATVSYVAPNGCVTVKYNGCTAQKTLEPERHHHLSPVTPGVQPGQPMPRTAPSAQTPAGFMEQPYGNFSPLACEQFGQGNYAPAPQEQMGNFKFDLAALCNDAGFVGS